MMLQTVNAQLTGMNATIKNMSVEGDARFTAIKAKLARQKNTDNKTKAKQPKYQQTSPAAGRPEQATCRSSWIPRGHHRARSNRLADKHDNRSRYVIRKEYKE